jgi:hypothetical protein
MNAVLLADVLIIAGLIVTLGLLGVLLDDDGVQRSRWIALTALAIGIAVVAAGRRFGRSAESDLIAWTLAAAALPRLWWPSRRSGRDGFATLSVTLATAALVMTLMWVAR